MTALNCSPKLAITRAIRLALGSLLLSSPVGNEAMASGHTEELAQEIRWLKEENFVTTATRTRESQAKSGAAVSVITRKDLQRTGARNLSDALKRVPGLDVHTTNIGTPAIEVRGLVTESSEKVLFLINGHSVNNNLVNGGATWTYAHFPIDDISRVEIVRGPASALYGADAFLAVINIITERGDELDGEEVLVAGGGRDTRQINLSSGRETGAINYAVNLNLFETNGDDAFVAEDAAGRSGEIEAWGRRVDLGFNLQHDSGLGFQGKYVRRKGGPYVGINNQLNDESEQDFQEYFLELSHEAGMGANTALSSRLYFDHFEADSYWELVSENVLLPDYPDGVQGKPSVKNQKLGIETQFTWLLRDAHKFLAGALFEHQTQYDVKHETNFDPNTGAPLGSFQDISDSGNWNGSHRRDLSAVYAQSIWDVTKQLRFITGARYDRYSDFGDELNPRMSMTWEFIPDYHLMLAYGEAFRAPAFGELHNKNNPAIQGNPDLDAEEIESVELGISAALTSRSKARATVFRNKVKDVIRPGNPYQNYGRFKVWGVETEWQHRLQQGSIFNLNYTYQYPEDERQNTRSSGVPMHKANAGVTWRISQHYNAYAGLHHRGRIKRAAGDGRSELKDQTSLDLAFNALELLPGLDLQATLYNVSDENLRSPSAGIPDDIPEGGRHFMLEARYQL
ncbi:MAG: TonB-dependent receptor [Oleiphilaceae bacterium]|nr:TonB-dependent receptor [Oleiphilaceae bacterium]